MIKKVHQIQEVDEISLLIREYEILRREVRLTELA